MALRRFARSGTSVTVLLLLLPLVLLSFSTYCGDDDGSNSLPDTGPLDGGPFDDGSPDTLGPDTVAGSGTCCWGPTVNEQCIEVEGSVCTGTFHAGGSCSASPCESPSLTSDPTEDFIDSVRSAVATFTGSQIDIVGFGAWIVDMPAKLGRDVFNIDPQLPCGTAEADLRVVCVPNMMGGPTPMPAGDMLMATMEMATDIPAEDASHSLIYTLALESDGDGANDWQYRSTYNWDTFQGTDRWYSLTYNHFNKQWTIGVTQVNGRQEQEKVLSSTVRAVIRGKTITFFVSMEEIPASAPKYRLVAFGHDGKYSSDDRGSDVNGNNPTEALAVPQ